MDDWTLEELRYQMVISVCILNNVEHSMGFLSDSVASYTNHMEIHMENVPFLPDIHNSDRFY